jgi:hypothetical protein
MSAELALPTFYCIFARPVTEIQFLHKSSPSEITSQIRIVKYRKITDPKSIRHRTDMIMISLSTKARKFRYNELLDANIEEKKKTAKVNLYFAVSKASP